MSRRVGEEDLPTLDEFIFKGPNKFSRSSYVTEPGFKHLYVRWGFHNLGLGVLTPCLDLANLEVIDSGQGTFTRLIQRLRATYPEMNLYVENVMNPRFAAMLPRLGFVYRDSSEPCCFYLLATK